MIASGWLIYLKVICHVALVYFHYVVSLLQVADTEAGHPI